MGQILPLIIVPVYQSCFSFYLRLDVNCGACHNRYPSQYVTRKLGPSDKITIDGKLDEPAWENAEWTYDMVDITRHENQQLNAIPNDLQARVKIRWDDDYFYVGAVLHESYITAKNTGHNDHAPYSPDNVSQQNCVRCALPSILRLIQQLCPWAGF